MFGFKGLSAITKVFITRTSDVLVHALIIALIFSFVGLSFKRGWYTYIQGDKVCINTWLNGFIKK